MPEAVPESVLDRVFRTARTPARWREQAVPQSVLHALYDLVKLGPTSANCSPGRFVFLESVESRERLRPALSAGNVERTMRAAVTVIVAQDPLFYEHLPRLYPQAEARSWFAADAGLADETAFRNATLQGGYLILCGPDAGAGRRADVRLRHRQGRRDFFPCPSLGRAVAGQARVGAPTSWSISAMRTGCRRRRARRAWPSTKPACCSERAGADA